MVKRATFRGDHAPLGQRDYDILERFDPFVSTPADDTSEIKDVYNARGYYNSRRGKDKPNNSR